MAALYRLCAVAMRPFVRARATTQTIVSGFNFSIVGDDGGLGTLFMRAVWGDETGDSERRFPRLLAHRPERVRTIHRDLARTWETDRARYVTPAGDDYGDWFAGEFENVLRFYGDASKHGRWVTNDPDELERALSPAGLPRLPLPDLTTPYDGTPSEGVTRTIGVAGVIALGALGIWTWRRRRIAAKRARSVG